MNANSKRNSEATIKNFRSYLEGMLEKNVALTLSNYDRVEVDLAHYNGEVAIFWFKGGATIEYDIVHDAFGPLLYANADPDALLASAALVRELCKSLIALANCTA